MINITVHLVAALICIDQSCYPALVGSETPVGKFQLEPVKVAAAGYGGSILAFHEDASGLFAVHRPWLGRPTENRLERLAGVGDRMVTAGCINVNETIYEWIEQHCSRCELEIVE